jgi:hypothetical protein
MHTHNGYYSNAAFSNKTLQILKKMDSTRQFYMCGITPVADPHSGFHDVYTARYGQTPIFGEAELYDAIMISCLAYAISTEFNISLNSAVYQLLETEGKHMGGWTCDAIRWSYEQIVGEHTIPTISGASGDLSFTPDIHSIINY